MMFRPRLGRLLLLYFASGSLASQSQCHTESGWHDCASAVPTFTKTSVFESTTTISRTITETISSTSSLFATTSTTTVIEQGTLTPSSTHTASTTITTTSSSTVTQTSVSTTYLKTTTITGPITYTQLPSPGFTPLASELASLGINATTTTSTENSRLRKRNVEGLTQEKQEFRHALKVARGNGNPASHLPMVPPR
ncbi:hypothetical protein DOTSEDRAFT_90652 [Dothistroma septosporum NZE10]|uniref:Uncharacterized protein n=1 Tax=Dothistroma septosporum (strain NZE10 / CBS 128990) TaxID=675120 RepID=N1PGF4_DOTSN|nr:hypothetical protein DOTSEDRAFT_90652 [Dothistroma septosporum NZE10]